MFHTTRHKIDSHYIDVTQAIGGEHAVVLVHGIGVSGNYFMPLATLLARQCNVHVLDMPGYGKTPKPSRPLTLQQQAEVVAKYIEKLSLKQPTVIGQSMGAQTVAHLADKYPALCRDIILIGPVVNIWERNRAWQAFRLLMDSFVEPFKMNLIILHDYIHMGPRAYFKTLNYMLDYKIENTLSSIMVPVCIIRGSRDSISPARWARHLSSIVKTSEVHHISGGPHNVQYANPQEVFELCKKFLER